MLFADDSPPALMPHRASLIAQTAAALRAHAAAGYWPQRLPTERELCQRLQVSRPTLRAALQELEQTGALKWQGRARCWSKNLSSTSLITRHHAAPTIAILTPRPPRAWHRTSMLVLDTLRDKFSQAGFRVELRVDSACFTATPGRALLRATQQLQAAVWVAFGSKEPMQRWFLRQRLPLFVIGTGHPTLPVASMDADYGAAGHHAASLLQQRGRRRLVLVLPRDAYGGDVECEHGFRKALERHPEVHLQVLRHDGSPTHLRALWNRLLRAPQPPDACFVVNPLHALTTLTHLQRRGIRIPQDMAIIVNRDDGYLAHTSPVLSRYQVDPERFAQKAAKAIHELAETGRSATRSIRLIPRFLAGETL